MLTLSVLTSAGLPARGALAAIAPEGHSVEVVDGRSLDDDEAFVRATADQNGTLCIDNRLHPGLLVVIHPSGYACLTDQELTHTREIALRPWCKASGVFRAGNRPVAGRRIHMLIDTPRADNRPGSRFLCEAVTDEQGRFAGQHLMAGRGKVIELASTKLKWFTDWRWGLSKEADFSPDEEARVDLGGCGRSVIGRILPPTNVMTSDLVEFRVGTMWNEIGQRPVIPFPASLENAALSERQAWYNRWREGPQYEKYMDELSSFGEKSNLRSFVIRADGQFEIENVPPGKYGFSFSVFVTPAGGTREDGFGSASQEASFVVEPVSTASNDPPVRIPDIQLRAPNRLHPGDTAPPMVNLRTLDEKPTNLDVSSGKFLLIDFWATWCGPCLAEIPNLQKVHAQFSRDERFELVSISLDDVIYAPRKFLAERSIPWRQLFGGSIMDAPVAKDYRIESIPYVMLIGPDGKIIATHLRGGRIEEAVRKALGE